VPDDTALRRAIDRQRENDAIESMMDAARKAKPFYQMRAESLEHLRADMAEADRLDTEPYGGDLLSWACQRIDYWRNCYFRAQSRYDNLRRVCWICFGLAAVEFLIVIYATWGHS
jgi:hypothetical protein